MRSRWCRDRRKLYTSKWRSWFSCRGMPDGEQYSAEWLIWNLYVVSVTLFPAGFSCAPETGEVTQCQLLGCICQCCCRKQEANRQVAQVFTVLVFRYNEVIHSLDITYQWVDSHFLKPHELHWLIFLLVSFANNKWVLRWRINTPEATVLSFWLTALVLNLFQVFPFLVMQLKRSPLT